MSLKLEQLHHLVAVVEHGSLRAASRRLGVPQPALTRSIRALERQLGAELFTRASQGMTLTELGRRFHHRASAIVHEMRRAHDELAQGGGDEHGQVVVALSILPHLLMLPRALPVFRRRYPNVRLHLIEGLFPDVEERLRTGQVDFYLGAAPRRLPAPGLRVRPLFAHPRSVVCHPGHPLREARSLELLVEAAWATTAIDYDAERDLGEIFAQYGLRPPRVMLQARTATSLVAALTGDLLALVPMQWHQSPQFRGLLQAVPVSEPLPPVEIALLTRDGLPMTPAAEYLCDVLLRELPAPASPPQVSGLIA
ncbi:LysR family transcriptional regulator [Rubrivivax gelatinosus]|uniref:Transcriptional regulator, LysR family n=1 Tax=Rubrivivax gelatinosus (strain NBRC 100245 / IL144) TaxID=983917 RepID=I0HNH1_RUBGI|nr:LysR substrate-binding domain-containing protein [Rubrivivax gelatinosus]BAL94558.1 transcriptional regulator, LysR family [Rubrivivax gelatinosus IL144]